MTNLINKLPLFATSDINLAATLSLFSPMDGIDKANPRKSIFLFKRENGLDEYISSYWRRELNVEPQALLSQLKAIKTRLYEI
jgi:hypothetical protein